MNERQKAFADEYIISLNAEKSANKAGYSANYSKAQSYKLLEKIGIKEYIQKRLKQKENSRIASAEEVLETITEILRDQENKAGDRLKALELLGKRYALYVDKVEATNNNIEVVLSDEERRKRIEELRKKLGD